MCLGVVLCATQHIAIIMLTGPQHDGRNIAAPVLLTMLLLACCSLSHCAFDDKLIEMLIAMLSAKPSAAKLCVIIVYLADGNNGRRNGMK